MPARTSTGKPTARDRCPEAIDGRHGPANTTGHCPYLCGVYLGRGPDKPWPRRPRESEVDLLLAERPGQRCMACGSSTGRCECPEGPVLTDA